jgi:hypothetical protein
MPKVTRYERVRIHAYVDGELARRLATYGAAAGMTCSMVVRAALGQYLDRTGDTTLILRRLDRLGRAENRTQRDLEFLSEAFSVFVRLWLAQTPSVADDAKDLARRSAESRYRQYVEYIVQQFTGGHRFLDDLPREVLADETELANIAAEASAPTPSVGPEGGGEAPASEP